MAETFNIKGLDGIIETLHKLPPEVVSKRGGPVKLALAKSARIIRNEARRNVQQITQGSPRSTGALQKAIISTRGKVRSGQKGERQIVWIRKVSRRYVGNIRNLRSGRAGKLYFAEGPQFYGRFIEFGTKKMRERSFLRKAFNAKGPEAVRVFVDDLGKRTEKLMQDHFNAGRNR